MAKAKKSESSDQPAKKPTRKAAGSKAAGKKSPAQASAPMVDTSLAAEAAAKMIANRAKLESAGSGDSAAPRESDAFKQLKQSLNKPKTTLTNPLLANVQNPKKGNQPLLGGQQIGRNQTFGADVNRSGVPRRTSG